MQALKLLGQQLGKIWNQLGINQKVIIVASGFAVLGGLAALVLWSSRPNFTLLYGRLDSAESGRIISALEEMKVQHRMGGGGSSIYVPQAEVHRVRAQLATKGMPKSEGVGFEIFDKPAFGMSDFIQRANYLRAIQGELARAIEQIDGIEQARVMIVKPESRLIVDPDKKPTASVMVKMAGMRQLEMGAVNSIRLLVANAVEGLKPNNVSIVDNNGNVLSEPSDEGSLASLGASQLAMRRSVEKYLADKVRSMLEKVLGVGEVVVSVSAEINNERITKMDEVYDPTRRIPRSETVRQEITHSSNPTPTGIPGTPTNVNTGTNDPAFMSSNNMTKTDTTSEFAISVSKTNLVREAGGLTRVSASVFVNANSNTNLNTVALKEAVVNALGLKVGTDIQSLPEVTLYAVPFNQEKALALNERMDNERRTEFLWTVGRSLLYVLLGLGALFGFYRLVKNSSEELLPTGIPVGQLIGGQVVYETPVGQPGLALPTGVVQTMAEQKAEEAIAGDEDVENLQAAKSKMVMDFGLGQQAPERITIEVLKQLIRENPEKMSQAARIWMSKKESQDS